MAAEHMVSTKTRVFACEGRRVITVSKFKVGDKVKIYDRSWLKAFVDGEQKNHKAMSDLVYIVLSDDLSVPSGARIANEVYRRFEFHTTILQFDNLVVFTHRDLLRPAICPECKRSYD